MLPAEWKSAEISASRQQPRFGRDRRELGAEVVRETHDLHPRGEQPPLVLDPERAVAADPARGDDAVARDEEREAVLGAERAGGACRPLPAGERRELAVADDLAPRDTRAAPSASASWNGVAQSLVQRHVRERDALAAEVPVERLEQFGHESVTVRRRLSR